MEQSPEYYDDKWTAVIKALPNGGQYRFDLRKVGYQIICDYIGTKKRVFDYACGLGIIDGMLRHKNECDVAGCDYSEFAINYLNKHVSGDFRTTEDVWGKWDFIIACYFLEHIKDPVGWIRNGLKHAPKIICSIPNDFRQQGEHIDMQWKNWDEFHDLFAEFKPERIDEGKYPEGLIRAFKHPVVVFSG